MFEQFFTLSALTFLLISLVNVILSTIKSLCLVRYGRGVSILMNVVAYGFYTIVVQQVANLPLPITVVGTMVANALGVWVSYVILDKFNKDKLWCVQVSVKEQYQEAVDRIASDIPHNCVKMSGGWVMFNFYCETQKQTSEVKTVGKMFGAKFCAFESKNL